VKTVSRFVKDVRIGDLGRALAGCWLDSHVCSPKVSLGRADIAMANQRYMNARIEVAGVVAAGVDAARVDATEGSRFQLRSSFL